MRILLQKFSDVNQGKILKYNWEISFKYADPDKNAEKKVALKYTSLVECYITHLCFLRQGSD